MSLTSTCKHHPSGDTYIQINVGTTVIGTAVEVDGGFLVQGKRKPVPTLKDAEAVPCTQFVTALKW